MLMLQVRCDDESNTRDKHARVGPRRLCSTLLRRNITLRHHRDVVAADHAQRSHHRVRDVTFKFDFILPCNSFLSFCILCTLSLSFGFVIIEHRYRIQRGNESATTSVGLTTSFTAISLEPYTLYDFRVLACTSAGCSASAAGVCSTTTVF